MTRFAPPRTVMIAGVPVHDVTFDEAADLIAGWGSQGSGGYVYTPNVDDIVKAAKMPAFRSAVLGARLRVPDGMGIVYGARIAGTHLRGTVTGRKLPMAVGQRLAGKGEGIALFGGPPQTAELAAASLAQQGVRVADAFGPPMGFQVGSRDDAAATERLRASGAKVVFVGLGAPKQALWMERRARDLDGAVLVGVGAAIDVLAGRIAQAPDWTTRIGLEWAFRLAVEPRRLARRYLVDDPRFFWWMLRQRWRGSAPSR